MDTLSDILSMSCSILNFTIPN